MTKKLLWNYFLFDSAVIEFSSLNDDFTTDIEIIGEPNIYSKNELTASKLSSFGAKNVKITPWANAFYEDEPHPKNTEKVYDIEFNINMLSPRCTFSFETVRVDDFKDEDSFKLWRELRQ